ncbi:dipicolinic acid synthetase subunit A [Evansella sp. LMS18]|uniref:dipicolinic acid synthetase subunit A n=1 Tax=Evansella sp. LMS18 TaxID=2924033 RepID=UPI0020D05DA7|nr:dipicolinic acid synthetase subunit A [Evansella sp. LMS18]UTR10819.1 dipicolinic acid synthetase subunit A [Evansella sp. LMS18]
MLTDMHIAIVGGDARQLEIIRKLSEQDGKLSLIGFDQLDDGFAGANKHSFDTLNPASVDAVVLPVSGMNNEGEVESIFSKNKIILREEWLDKTPGHCVLYTGISNNLMKTMAKRTGKKLVELFERDDIAIYNSVPTAEGTLMMIIQNTNITIHGSKIIVSGFGRTGMTIARTLKALGADVEVAANEGDLRARAFEMHMESYPLKELAQRVRDKDVIVNTIPAKIFTADILSKMPAHTLIVDVASKPGGTDFRYAEKRGIKALLAPGLPGIVAPKTAGKIIANVLADLLKEQLETEKGGNS